MYFNNVILKIKRPQERKTWQKYFQRGIKVLLILFLHISLHYPELIFLGAETL